MANLTRVNFMTPELYLNKTSLKGHKYKWQMRMFSVAVDWKFEVEHPWDTYIIHHQLHLLVLSSQFPHDHLDEILKLGGHVDIFILQLKTTTFLSDLFHQPWSENQLILCPFLKSLMACSLALVKRFGSDFCSHHTRLSVMVTTEDVKMWDSLERHTFRCHWGPGFSSHCPHKAVHNHL